MAFADLDGLKEINDTHEHAAGDALIQATADRLHQSVRSGDIVARMGGDELLIILPGVHTLDEAVKVIDTSRRAVERTAQPGQAVSGTVSIGVTSAREGDTSDDVVARADHGMYEAKRTSNRVVGVP